MQPKDFLAVEVFTLGWLIFVVPNVLSRATQFLMMFFASVYPFITKLCWLSRFYSHLWESVPTMNGTLDGSNLAMAVELDYEILVRVYNEETMNVIGFRGTRMYSTRIFSSSSVQRGDS